MTAIRVGANDFAHDKSMKHEILPLLITLLLIIVQPVHAQQSTGARIGVLSSGVASDPRNKAGLEVMREALQKLGYVNEKSISFEQRFADRKLDRLAGLADDLVRLKVDIVFAIDTNAARAAKQASSTVPIVIVTGGHPVRSKLVTSLARPGGNVTGLTTDSPRLAEKRLGLLKEAAPKLSRIGYLSTFPADGAARAALADAQPAAKALGVKFQAVEIKAEGNPNFEGVFQFVVRDGFDGLVTEGPPIVSSNRKKILQLAEKYRIPAIHTELEWINDGGLMSYGANRVEPYRRAAVFIDKILKGTKPGDLPVEQPTKFEFAINLKAAKQIGVTIPQSMLYRADRVIR